MKKILISAFVLLAFVFVAQLVRAEPTAGLVVHYTFDNGTAVDNSGNNNNGTISGAVPTAGKVGGALSFDGVNDEVSATFNHNIGTGDFTWSAWIYPRRASYNWYEGVMSIGYYSPNLSVNPGGSGEWGAYWDGAHMTGDTIARDTWTHVTMARQGGIVRFYKNGVQAPGTHSVTSPMWNNIFRVGQNGNSSYFYGNIDDVRFYNRALSQSEITEVYNFGEAPVPPDTESPTTPTNFVGNAVSQSQINLSWSASSDNVGVVNYRVSRNGSITFLTASTNYSDAGLTASTEYSYTVTALDAVGNESGSSASISITTPAPAPASHTLNVLKSGNGSGTISGTGIDCGSDCSEVYTEGSIITLNATPLSSSNFTGWTGGGCSGTGQCIVTLNSNTSVTAGFTLISNPIPGAGEADTYSGSANTPLATYDARYRNARSGYVVSNLSLDGSGNVGMNGSYSGGFSFYSNDTSPTSQLSQITLLGIPQGGSTPRVRMLVQTEENDSSYYGWEFNVTSNNKYVGLTWFRGAEWIAGRWGIDVSQYNFDMAEDLVLRTSVEYPESNRAIVRAYAGTSEATLIEISSIEVQSGVGVIAQNGYPSDSSVPFLTGRRPGMLYHMNSSGITVRPLFKLFTDGLSTFLAPRTEPLSFFVDYTNGNDANDGLSKTSAWKRAPGMSGFAGNYTKYPGDSFTLKGGTTWAYIYPWTFLSGTFVNPIIYTVDPTWFNGPSFTEPVFN